MEAIHEFLSNPWLFWTSSIGFALFIILLLRVYAPQIERARQKMVKRFDKWLPFKGLSDGRDKSFKW